MKNPENIEIIRILKVAKIICQLQAWFDVNYVGKPN